MSVSSNSLLEKMQQELEQAKIKQEKHEDIDVHISKIQLLCELLLEASPIVSEAKETGAKISEQEKLAMFGKLRPRQRAVTNKSAEKSTDDFSIFDF